MFGPLGSLVGLAADALFDTVSQLSVPVAEEVWRTRARDQRAVTDSAALQEIAEHLAAVRALLEDVRNTQQRYVDIFEPAPRTRPSGTRPRPRSRSAEYLDPSITSEHPF